MLTKRSTVSGDNNSLVSAANSPTDSASSQEEEFKQRLIEVPAVDLKETHALALYFFKYVLSEQSVPENDCRKVSRHIAIGLSLLVASLSGIPYITPSRDAFGTYTSLGWIAAFTTIISFGVGSSWAWLNIMSELDPQSPEEMELYRGKHARKTRLLFANLFGALATLPPAFAVYKFNDNFTYPVIAFSAGVATNIYALYKLYDGKKLVNQGLRFLKKCHSQKTELDLNLELIDSLGEILAKTHILYLNTSVLQRNVVMPSLFNVQLSDAQAAFEEFIKEAIQLHTVEAGATPSEEWLDGWPRLLVMLLSAIFPIAFSIVNASLSYESSVLIYDEFIFSLIYIILTVVPYMSIEFLAAAKTFESLYDQTFNLLTKQDKQSLPKRYYPGLNMGALITSSILGIIPSTSRIYITINTIKGAGQLPLTIIGAMGGTIFQSFVLFDFSHKVFIKHSQLQTSNIEQQQLAGFVKRMDKFMQIYESCDATQLNNLVSGPNNQIVRSLLLQYHELKGRIERHPDGYEVIKTSNEEKSQPHRNRLPATTRRVSFCDNVKSFFFRPAPPANNPVNLRIDSPSLCRIC